MNRFRKWLIKKLGGYTEPPYKQLAFPEAQIKTISEPITICMRIPSTENIGKSHIIASDYISKQKYDMAERIGKKIIEGHLYDVGTTKIRDIIFDDYIIRILSPVNQEGKLYDTGL